jgi:hypothetical protein
LVETPEAVLLKDVPPAKAEKAKADLEAVGATVEIRPRAITQNKKDGVSPVLVFLLPLDSLPLASP